MITSLIRFLVIFIICLAHLTSEAQQNTRFVLKPSLGIAASQLHGDNYSGYNKLGGMAGLYVNALLKKNHSLEFGIIYVQKGARKNQNVEKGDYTFYLLRLNYVEVPLLYRWQHNKFFFTIGASYAYLINYYESSSELGNYTGLYPFLRSEYSSNLGIGMNLTPKIGVEVRANNSFLTIRPWPSTFRPYYNNILARTFNNGSYSNILQIAFTYKLSPRKDREPKEEI
jgi:hypothetical protein